MSEIDGSAPIRPSANPKAEEGWPPQSLYSDEPLEDVRKDRLGRAEFARHLARAITQMDTDQGFVFAVNGPWGSGKTTIINFALESLSEDPQAFGSILVVRFNPWWFSGSEQLMGQFFREFRGALGKPGIPDRLRSVRDKLDIFAKGLSVASYIPFLKEIAEPSKEVVTRASEAVRAIIDARSQDLHQIRDEICTGLLEQDYRILVVIDDIDRLPAKEIRQVFQLVKAVAHFPRTIYLLAFDRKVVVDSLDGIQGGTGEDYLDKIVQLPLDIPMPDRMTLRRWVFDELTALMRGTADYLFDASGWADAYINGIEPFIETPRGVKRFMNALRPTYPAVRGEVNAVDFLVVQALRIFVPEFYRLVGMSKEGLTATREDGRSPWSTREERKNLFDSMLAKVPASKREVVDGAMSELFTEWSSAFHGDHTVRGNRFVWKGERRICSPQTFDVYFRLFLLPTEISDGQLRASLDLVSEPKLFSRELLRLADQVDSDGISRCRKFLERLEGAIGHYLSNDQVEPFLRALYQVADQLLAGDEWTDPLALGNSMLLYRITLELLWTRKTQRERFDLLRQTLGSAEAASLVTFVVTLLGQEHGRNRSRGPLPEAQQTFRKSQMDQLEQVALRRIAHSMEDGSLGRAPQLGMILHRVADWGSQLQAADYSEAISESDQGFCDLLAGFLSIQWQYEGARPKVRYLVGLPSLLKFLKTDTAELMRRCQEILARDPAWLTPRRERALKALQSEITDAPLEPRWTGL